MAGTIKIEKVSEEEARQVFGKTVTEREVVKRIKAEMTKRNPEKAKEISRIRWLKTQGYAGELKDLEVFARGYGCLGKNEKLVFNPGEHGEGLRFWDDYREQYPQMFIS